MAAIGRIRKHGVLAMVIIGLALLAFILGDLGKTGRSRETNVAVVNGEKISYQDYSAELNRVLDNYKQQAGTLTADQTQSVRNNVWESMVRETIEKEEFEALGLTVTRAELSDQMLGENPNPYVVQSFTNPETGEFDRAKIEGWIINFDSLAPQYQEQWINFCKYVQDERLNTKYENLITKGFYVPGKLAEKYYNEKNVSSTVELYAVRYSSVADSLIKISDADNKAFYKENSYKYNSQNGRDISYIIFDVKASEEDINKALQFVTDLKADFAATENVASFVNANSDVRIDTAWKFRSEVPVAIEDMLFGQKNAPGFVSEPYLDNNAYNIVRILGYDNTDTALRVQYATVTREITPSETTNRACLTKVNTFVTENPTLDQFNESADREGLNKRVYPNLNVNTTRISGLSDSREIVRWAFNKDTKVGDISNIFSLEDMYVVAALTKITKEGPTPYLDVVDQQRYPIINLKKGEYVVDQMAKYTDYNKMIDELKGEKANIDLTFGSNTIANYGVEYSTVGKIMAMAPGETSQPIAGNTSAFVVKVNSLNQAAKAENYNEIIKEKKNYFGNMVRNSAHYGALKDASKIKDNRLIFF